MVLKILIYFEVIFFFIFPQLSLSDVAFLKNGRQITADKIWIENGKVICAFDENTISLDQEDVLRIEQQEVGNIEEKEGFHFDGWQSGMNIGEILAVAKRHDIPLHKDGIISINKKFNPVTSSKYAKTATQYYYNTKLLGKYAKVDLFLTPYSKRLHTLSINWHGMANKNNRAGFEEELIETLSEKYGSPGKRYDQPLVKTKTWSPSPWIEIELQMTSGNFTAIYKDKEMLKLKKAEDQRRNEDRKEKYQKVDHGKF
jgi:hypothetical protein